MENRNEYQLLCLLGDVLHKGAEVDQAGHKRHVLFGQHLALNLNHNFPIMTTRAIDFDSAVDLALFVSQHLEKSPKSLYGQISMAITRLITQPTATDIVVEDSEFPYHNMHFALRDHPAKDTKLLLCHAYLPVVDAYAALPDYVILYALLMEMISVEIDAIPWDLSISLGHAYIGGDAEVAALEQVHREARPGPRLALATPVSSMIQDMRAEDFVLVNYTPYE